MSKYTNVKVNISEGQREKLREALENSVDEVSIHFSLVTNPKKTSRKLGKEQKIVELSDDSRRISVQKFIRFGDE